MARLRDPNKGCPWDMAQNFASIAPYTIEEAYEVDDAIRRGDMADLRAELGDLLFQAVFHSQMADEAGYFDLSDVVHGISEKMIKRHPHVFGDGSVEDADAQTSAWEARKAAERTERAAAEGRLPSALDDVPIGLPALLRAHKLQKRAARVGFDWPDAAPVLDKIEEEIGELREALTAKDSEHIAEEYGDLLFALSNLARHLTLDPEESLRNANAKFERRFKAMENNAQAESKNFADMSLEDQEELWQKIKLAEQNKSSEIR